MLNFMAVIIMLCNMYALIASINSGDMNWAALNGAALVMMLSALILTTSEKNK